MKKKLVATGFFLLTFCLPIKAIAASFDRIYIFGDSLSDVGNTYQATGNLIPQKPPYSEGRFSNGDLWVQYLAPKLGLTFNPNEDFAFAGATTGDSNIVGVPTILGLEQQINSFTAANPTADENALYIVWAGANDYLFNNVTNPEQPVTNLAKAVTSLAGVGAKNIMMVNLPDLGKLPGTSIYGEQASTGLNLLTQAHNTGLAAALTGLQQTLGNSVNLISMDVNSLFNDVIDNPGKYDLTKTKESCLTGFEGFLDDTYEVCNNPQNYLFWDGFHPTTAGHQVIANYAYSVLKPASVPEPTTTFSLLAFGVLGIGATIKRQRKISAEAKLQSNIVPFLKPASPVTDAAKALK